MKKLMTELGFFPPEVIKVVLENFEKFKGSAGEKTLYILKALDSLHLNRSFHHKDHNQLVEKLLHQLEE